MMKRIKIMVMCIITAILLVGCGSGGSKEYMTEAEIAPQSYSAGATSNLYAADVATVEEAVEFDEEQGLSVGESNRKLIKDVTLNAETEEFDELIANVTSKVEALDGYTEFFNVYGGGGYYDKGLKSANLTIRIPAQNLTQFVTEVSNISNITGRTESVRDVTLEYVDLESHKKSLQIEQQRLLELLEQAETIEDIVALESRLSEVRYQIESMESQLRTYDNLVEYSTIYLYISEVQKLTPVEEQNAWQRITSGFAASLENLGVGLSEFGIGLVIAIPYLVFVAILVLAVLIAVKSGIKYSEKKKLKKETGKKEVKNTEGQE